MHYLDYFLDRITMYRLLLYYLLALVAGAMLLGGLGYLPYGPLAIAISTVYLLILCWLANRVFAYVFEAPHNPESSLITALILALIIAPPALGNVQNFVFLSAAGGLAIASKYLLAIRGQHIFNPAAVAVVLTAFGGHQSANWWVGNAPLLPVVIVGGLLLTRKIRRAVMISVFMVTAVVMTTALAVMHGGHAAVTLRNTLLHSSLFFMGFVMLTEPLTSPTMANQQQWYGALAGLLFSPQIHILGVYSTPELVLLTSNAFAYVIKPKVRLLPRLQRQIAWGPSVRDFVFQADRQLKYRPGQYMEWTLPHGHPDSRGSRRYFTLASSPTEDNLRIGVKFYAKSSSYKQALWNLDDSKPIAAAQLGGDFTLPKDRQRKLVFIAGGIGITPFRSMLKYLIDKQEGRTVTLLYSERRASELAYYDVLDAARRQLGVKVVYTLTDNETAIPPGARTGRLDAAMIQQEVPDYLERLFYISGPHSLVTAVKKDLRQLGVAERNIKIDFFPGYA